MEGGSEGVKRGRQKKEAKSEREENDETRSERVRRKWKEKEGGGEGGREKVVKRRCEIEVSDELKNSYFQFPNMGIARSAHSQHAHKFSRQVAAVPLTSSTLMFSFALVSYNSMPIWSANIRASSVWTTFFSGQSFLFPTEVQERCGCV